MYAGPYTITPLHLHDLPSDAHTYAFLICVFVMFTVDFVAVVVVVVVATVVVLAVYCVFGFTPTTQ